MVSDLNKISSAKCGQNTLRMAPIFEDGNNKKDRPREGDLFDRSSYALARLFLAPKIGTIRYKVRPHFVDEILLRSETKYPS